MSAAPARQWVVTARDTLDSRRKWFVEFNQLGRPVQLWGAPNRHVNKFNSLDAAEYMAGYAASLEIAHVVGFEPLEVLT